MARKPVVIGIYGIQGCGKTTLINALKEELGENGDFRFYDGSQMLATVTPGT